MPWIARYEGEKKGAWQVPEGTDAECVECGGRLRVWSESTDGRARHFKHIDNMGGGEDGGGGSTCASVAESEIHLKWKNFVAERLYSVFSDVAECRVDKELRLEAPQTTKTHRQGDAVLTFETPDAQLGQGIVAEVQHKNVSKDIEATTSDYITQDYAVVWLSHEDFSENRCRLAEIDFRQRAREAVWPHHTPKPHRWWQPSFSPRVLRSTWRRATQNGLSQTEVLATLPSDYFDAKALDLWREQQWPDLFSPPTDYTDIWCYAKVPATLPEHWFVETAKEYWQSEPWRTRFRGSQPAWEEIYRHGHSAAAPPDPGVRAAVPFSSWLATAGADATVKTTIRNAYYRGFRERNEKLAIDCPHCGTEQLHDPIAPGETKRGRSCRHCSEWYTVYERV